MRSAPAARSSAVAALCCSLLVLLLPTLVVGLSLGANATSGELERLERSVVGRPPASRVDSVVSRRFHTVTIPDVTRWPDAPDRQQAVVVRARVGQLLGVTGLALLTYLVALLACGRLHALLACAALAVLPPVAASGHVLRPETPATLLALLSLLLLQVATQSAPGHRARAPRRSALAGGATMLCAALAAAMACEAMPALGEVLLVPGVVLVTAAVQLGLRGRRALRRRGLFGLPIRSINRRLVPWTATSLIAPAIALWVLSSTLTVPVEARAVTERTSDLLPAGVTGWLLTAMLVVGVVTSIVRVGVRFGRGSRIDAERVLFAYCAVFLLTASTGAHRDDPLPLAPAAAILVGEGVRTMLVLALGLLARRRGAVSEARAR